MFSSNQILEISGDLSHDGDLCAAIEFAIRKSEWFEPFTRLNKRIRPTFRIDEYSGYHIGWGKGDQDNWKEMDYDYDPDIIAAVVKQHLWQCDYHDTYCGDGKTSKGFLIKATDTPRDYGIIVIYPYTCIYAK